MVEGLFMMAIGMSVVFGFLGLMVLSLMGTAAYFGHRDARAADEGKTATSSRSSAPRVGTESISPGTKAGGPGDGRRES